MPQSFEPGTNWDAKPMSDDGSTGTDGPEPGRPRSLFDAVDSSRTEPQPEPGKPGSLFDAQPAYDDRRTEPDVQPRTLFDAQPMYEEKPMEPDMRRGEPGLLKNHLWLRVYELCTSFMCRMGVRGNNRNMQDLFACILDNQYPFS